MSDKNWTEFIQFCTSIVTIICASASWVAYYMHPKWRRHNYLYVKQIIIRCAAACCMLSPILIPEDLISREMLVITYFIIVTTAVLGTVHIVALGHIHIALSCQEIKKEETLVANSWYHMTAVTGIVLFTVKSIFNLELLAVELIAGTLLLAISTGNGMLLSTIFNSVNKCRLLLMFCVNTLGIMCDVLLVLYGGLLVNGDSVGLIHNVVKAIYTGMMVLKTILILCSKDSMDWKKCGSSSDEIIGM